MNRLFCISLLFALIFTGFANTLSASDSVTVHVKNANSGEPVKLGIPFPKGTLYSPDHVRVLNEDGDEILSQTTEVSTWEPADPSVKWLWVFFFTDESGEYTIEYGEDVRKTVQIENPIVFKNNQRTNGGAEVNTGPLYFEVNKGGSGFLDLVQLDTNGEGFTDDNIVATAIEGRGSFLDYINDSGIDTSRAVVHQQFIEKGSGPLHTIIKVVGEYEYSNPEHENSPFVTYIHAYAGKSYIKVYHTITYTGKPDKSEPLNGKQHADIATQPELIINEQERGQDEGLTEPYDMIESTGFRLQYNLDGEKTFRSELLTGNWWEEGESSVYEASVGNESRYSVFQTGPDATMTANEPNSTNEERIDGFKASISADGNTLEESQKAAGWVSISDNEFGVSIGIRNMMEEYPNELVVDIETGEVYAYTWSPNEDPMSFERNDMGNDGGMVGNFATGLTKTTETIFYFHEGSKTLPEIKETMEFVLDPPVAHADPSWYGKAGVYGFFADADNNFPDLERAMQYKFQWMLFNQNWEPWYGMFTYGDVKNYYFGDDWYQWANNEPSQDYMWWTNFIRTGDPEMYKMAQAASRHTMDVDNTHWPAQKGYRGDTNSSLDWFLSEQEEEGSPYLGMGRRHAGQQWISMLSAHVWLTGWVSSYYLDGYHRGLEIARLTGDYYIRRIFGDHGLRGRRLYLSIWNLSELYDATKEDKYLDELNYRVELALELQKRQGGRMGIDRYGYSQNYLSHGLTKYLQMFDRPDIEQAYLTHARSLRDVPPIDHDYESYLSSIHPLITAYDLSGESEFLVEACKRATNLMIDPMSQPFEDYETQAELQTAMEDVSNLPMTASNSFFSRRMPIWSFSMGLRIFGWTTNYSVPYLIERLGALDDTSAYQCAD
ncbi:exo-rhamnogalacturonan lyase family protein [Rhodohalobacter sp. 614A]|uniref:exo-rhamnogalacturonan lyase family protein n=1 Tax=Rhodohalobacter sp. 614A TaxID=2908649 RepID=UPI001F2B2015|nr:hypothetical protein [Rhodohalobacter sp. 614A]